MRIKYEGAPMGIFKIKVPPKIEITFVDGICEIDEIVGRRLLVTHDEFKKEEDKVENKESETLEITKAKVGRSVRKIEEVEASDAIKDFVKQI
jgi:hypothetical protein